MLDGPLRGPDPRVPSPPRAGEAVAAAQGAVVGHEAQVGRVRGHGFLLGTRDNLSSNFIFFIQTLGTPHNVGRRRRKQGGGGNQGRKIILLNVHLVLPKCLKGHEHTFTNAGYVKRHFRVWPTHLISSFPPCINLISVLRLSSR